MSLLLRSTAIVSFLVVAGCANEPSPSKSSEAPVTSTAKSTDSKSNVAAEGAIVGTPAKNSKFAKLKIGHTFREVTDLIGAPDDIHRHETGKRWIPFYFGSDVMRMQASYKGEGCLTYTGGNQFGSSGGELITITVDPAGCV